MGGGGGGGGASIPFDYLLISSVTNLGVRNSESSPVLFSGSEILNPLLCYFRDQIF